MTPFARIEVRTALPSDKPEIWRIWRESFGDDEDYISFFWTRRFVPDNTPVLTADDKVVSQLFLLPAQLRTGETLREIYYLFAAATDPAYRSMGCMARLLDYAATLSSERGKAAIALLPGTQDLYRYYAKHGYITAFRRRVLTCSREALPVVLTQPRDAAEALQTFFRQTEGVVWDENAIRYALDEHSAFRGKFAASQTAFVAVSGEEATVLAPSDAVCEGLSLLRELSDAPQFTVTLPPDAPVGTPEAGGMIRFLQEKFSIQNACLPFAME